MTKQIMLSLITLAIAGCNVTPNQQYYWGNYEALIYDSYNKPGSATPELQIKKITQDIERAKSSRKKIPPGLYAHLGMMYASQGNRPLAMAAFDEEKKLFPESSVLIDGMIERSNNAMQQ